MSEVLSATNLKFWQWGCGRDSLLVFSSSSCYLPVRTILAVMRNENPILRWIKSSTLSSSVTFQLALIFIIPLGLPTLKSGWWQGDYLFHGLAALAEIICGD